MQLTTGQQEALDKISQWDGSGQFVLRELSASGKIAIEWDDGYVSVTKLVTTEEEFEQGLESREKHLLVDHAYCVTAHKAQGSQWDSVLVYDDSGYIRDPKERRKWQYTSLARAIKKLTWIRKT